jgi:hypothetical protein
MGVLKTCVHDSVIKADGWRSCTNGKITAVYLRLPKGYFRYDENIDMVLSLPERI